MRSDSHRRKRISCSSLMYGFSNDTKIQKEFEKEVNKHKETTKTDQSDEDDDEMAARHFKRGYQGSNDPRILGYSLEDAPYYGKLAFLVVVSCLFLALLIYGTNRHEMMGHRDQVHQSSA